MQLRWDHGKEEQSKSRTKKPKKRKRLLESDWAAVRARALHPKPSPSRRLPLHPPSTVSQSKRSVRFL